MLCARLTGNSYPHMSVTVLEKEPEVAHHQTGHNSGVIHAGMYYEPGSTMARLCVQGADMIYEFCGEENIPVARVGKLICAPTAEDHHHVTMLKERGDLNGVKDLEVLSGSEVRTCAAWLGGESRVHRCSGVGYRGWVGANILAPSPQNGKGDVALTLRLPEKETLIPTLRSFLCATVGGET